MPSTQLIVMGGVPRAYGVTYDGANDFLQRGSALDGVSTDSVGSMSFWLKMNGGDGSAQNLFQIYAASYIGMQVTRISTNELQLITRSTGNLARCTMYSGGGSITADGSWHSVLMCWDSSSAALNKFYLDGVDVTDTPASTAGDIGYAAPTVTVGADRTGANKMDCDLAEFWFAPGQYLDFTDSAVRAKFLTSLGRPAFLGAGGARPTGVQPAIYLKGPASLWGTNYGAGGDFSITGTFTDAGTSPSL